MLIGGGKARAPAGVGFIGGVHASSHVRGVGGGRRGRGRRGGGEGRGRRLCKKATMRLEKCVIERLAGFETLTNADTIYA